MQVELVLSSIRAFKIPVRSMIPTLEGGDGFIADMNFYKDNLPERGDIVLFKSTQDESSIYVKQVIGLPGEKIEIISRTVRINGQVLDENYLQYPYPENQDLEKGSYNVPQDSYFLLGDNRDYSQDSRHFGCIARSKIIGQARYIYWANDLSRIGKQLN